MSNQALLLPDENEVIEKRKDDKIISNVNVKQCFMTIIFSMIMLLLILVPYTFGSSGFHLSLEYLPFVGNGALISEPIAIKNGIATLLGLQQNIINILGIGLQYFILGFFAIIAFDLLAAIILAIFRMNGFRIVFKTLSIIFGFAMIAIALLGIVYILGIVGYCVSNGNIEEIIYFIENCGLILVLAITIMASFMAIKQFRWFAKLW